MSQKIKSITYDGTEIPLGMLNQKLQNEILNGTECESTSFGEYDFKLRVEYEPEPKLLKRPDGSLISEPPEGTKVIFIEFSILEDDKYRVSDRTIEYEYCKSYYTNLKQGGCFLIQDKHLAEKKSQQLTKQLEIQNEIDRLNVEEGWVVDWKDSFQPKYYLNLNHDHQIVQDEYELTEQSSKQYMSEATAETILAKYSQDDLKAYLGIIL
jgi:hypothetical protein